MKIHQSISSNLIYIKYQRYLEIALENSDIYICLHALGKLSKDVTQSAMKIFLTQLISKAFTSKFRLFLWESKIFSRFFTGTT